MRRIVVLALALLFGAIFANGQATVLKFPELKKSSKWISVRNVRLNYYEQGNSLGVPVIFIHGYTDSRLSFEPLIQKLPGSIHVYAISMRGFGNSFKPSKGYTIDEFSRDLAAFMRQLNISSAVIAGHSMGTIIAQKFALDHPEKTKALILISSFVNISNNPGAKELADYIAGMKSVDPAFVRNFQQSTIYNKIDSVYFEKCVGESMKVPLYVWKQTIAGLKEADFSNLLEFINQPALIIWGDQDNICMKAEQDQLKSYLGNAELRVMSGVGHAPHWEKPEQTANLIVNFLNRLY